ncbi:hypothetical protein Tco_1333850, partial [Tanacetum coccineum]
MISFRIATATREGEGCTVVGLGFMAGKGYKTEVPGV